ncbi:MAG: hypothetical protein F6K55_20955 [Moorea sp. SIO4A3]|nr:hypothetical protein [Moorena sp. SIO4A3]
MKPCLYLSLTLSKSKGCHTTSAGNIENVLDPRQEAKGKRQKAKGKRQEAKGRGVSGFFYLIKGRLNGLKIIINITPKKLIILILI